MELFSPPKNNNLITVLGLATGLLVYMLLQNYYFKPKSFEKELDEAMNKINKDCPIVVDSETQLNNAIALPDNVLQYNYELINVQKDSVNANDIDVLKEALEPRLINNMKTNPDMENFRNNQISLCYHYSDMDGKFLFKIWVLPNKYND